MSSFISSSSESKESESRSNTNPKKSYDVYLSFCSRDTGSFVSNLYTALSTTDEGVLVFWDDRRLRSGDCGITTSALNVIGECRFAVIVFSRNYANSRRCLQELEKIMECCRTIGQRVVPLFYDVNPSDGRTQTDMFGEAFDDFVHRLISMEETSEKEDKFMSWVAAINEATTFSRNESEDTIKPVFEAVTHVLNKLVAERVLKKTGLIVADYPIGVKSRVQDVIQLLKQSKQPLLLGIWGMVGIGKTFIAQSIYDQIGPYFEHKSFVEDVSGIVSSEERVRHKRVLLIFDNVTKMEQLNALCGSREWFGEGSKIIITTRNRHLLKEHGVDHIYSVKELDQTECLEVFSLHMTDQVNPTGGLYAKMDASPKEDFVELPRRLFVYSGGLHLALEVFGSYLRQQPEHQWMDVLRSPDKIHISRVQNALETSFSKDLNDKEKQIFLDIACFFIGMDKNDALYTLNRSTQSAALQISLLEDKSFVTIDENSKLGMHVLLQDMAREIIMRESRSKPEAKTFDVSLSFRGGDTRAKFISHLYSSLQNAGIYVFRDDNEIQRGDQISFSLLQAIERSRICIVVLSTNYANSRWCMLELEKIMEIGRFRGVVVVPVFYEVDPSEVRKLTGQFGKAFKDLISTILVDESMERKWRRDLFGIGGIAGFVIIDSRNESADIKTIVERVTHLLDRTELFVAEHPVGVESRVQAVTKMLNIQNSEDVSLLGIWGMVGMGKTTIAKAIYNQIGREFEGRSFLLNIREVWEKYTNRVSLQQLVLCDIYEATTWKIHDIESGKNILKERLPQKRVLLVLDDVNELDQLKALCGSHEWFGPGSRIIITTRDKHLLRSCRVDHVYEIEEMDESESLELFSWYAFKQESPREYFAAISRAVIAYCGRLPLALEVLGSYLFARETSEWESALVKLERIPNDEVQKKLRLSFDGLIDDTAKQIFLDIACFFIGMDRNDAIQILNRCGIFADIGIRILIDQSLVTVDNKNKLRMHVLLQAMAREIIRRESRNKPEPKTFDVFLSFRGEESSAKFISRLYSSLQNAGIHVFKDDDEIQRGDQISISLLHAIGRSRISIVVLSTNYANSRWCMLELEKIMEVGRSRGLVVVPVFYGVDPSEVRHQKGQFGEAFEDLISRISVAESTKTKWRKDLFGIGGIAGFVIIKSRNENADIKNIVERVTRLLDGTELFVAEHPVGVESRVQDVTKLLNIKKSEDVLLLGIWGMGGMGKTTIAKAIYNQIGREFDGRSFLLNIREAWEKDTNRASLQQLVLCDIYKTTTLKIPNNNIELGKNILKERLAQKRVLLVLDDVSESDQLKALCGSRQWFGPGSRIIITTRDMDLLRSCSVDHKVRIEELNESESVELFSWHAFKQESPSEDFAALSGDVIAYSGRLPLALEVLGSYLFDRGIKEWQSVLKKLKIIPNNQVQEKLKISFDGLSFDTEKQIFLDIACFFIGKDRNDAIQILNGCGFCGNTGINVLVERSLVTVDSKNKLRMHDLLRDMGREIIREESLYDPEKRSRLWHPEEVLDILSKQKGTEAVEGLALELPRKNTICLNTKAFKKMKKLRLLQLAGVQLSGDFKHLSGDLRWLYWHGFPLTSTPAEFQHGSLVAIELKYSNLTQIWEKIQMLENLKILNLSHSRDLAETTDFSYLPNLEKLVLKDCPSLSAVSHTIGSLHKLLLINLEDCTSLQNLPRSMYKLESLETLILSGCSMIDKLEEDLEQMESLTTLIADRTAITKVPFSIVRSKSIGYISLCGFEGFSRDVFPSLIRSWMSPTNNVISLAQTSASMSSLASLDFPYGSSYSLPSSFKDVLKLRSLCVECGSEPQLTQDVARILYALKATNCEKPEVSASTSQISDTDVSPLIDYHSPVHISRSRNYSKSLLIQMGTKCQVPYTAKDIILQTIDGTGGDPFLLPGDNNPDWLTFSCKGCSVKFEVPKMEGRKLKKMTLGIVYSSSSDNITSEGCQGVLIMNYTKTNIQVYGGDTLTSFEDKQWQSITSNLEPSNKVEVIVVFGEGFIVEKTTIYLLYDEPIGHEEMEHFHAVAEEDVIVSDDDVSEEISNYLNPPEEENWDDKKEENDSKYQKDKSKAVQTSKSKTTMTSKKGSQTNTSLKRHSTSEDESKISKRTRKRKKGSSTKQTKKQKPSFPKKLKVKHSVQPLSSSGQPENTSNLFVKRNGTNVKVTPSNTFQTEQNIISNMDIVGVSTENPNQQGITVLLENNLAVKQVVDIEKKVESCCESSPPPKGAAGGPGPSNSNLSYIDDFKKMLDNDPVAVMEKLASGEFNRSSRNMQTSSEVATSQIDLSALGAELEKLRRLAFSNKLFAELPGNQELQAAVNASIQYIEARHMDLTSQQYVGFSEFSKLFNKAIESINVGNIVGNHLSQLAYEENEFVAALQYTLNEVKQFETSIDTGRKRMTEIEAESKQIEDEIATLKEKLRLIKQEKKVLKVTCTSCKVKHEEAINKGKDISTIVFSIREKIAGYESQERENIDKYVELTDSYKRMKAFPPF